eukprot:scaffold71698_cov32-Prasinocladus_malaysianus.AAC.2
MVSSACFPPIAGGQMGELRRLGLLGLTVTVVIALGMSHAHPVFYLGTGKCSLPETGFGNHGDPIEDRQCAIALCDYLTPIDADLLYSGITFELTDSSGAVAA